MQSISIFSKIIRFFVAFVVAVCLSCFESHADDCVLGTDGCAPEFTVTTTELSAGTTFSFEISAAGTYNIDWGDGGAIKTIVKNSVGRQTITHTYTNAGQYTIGMSGQATLYSTDNTTAAISFKENTNISGISGSLGAIFGTLTDRVNSDGTLMSDAQPRFYATFYDCSNLSGSIPENLFAGISGAPASYMFSYTFYGCSGLSGSIPENLFAGIKGAPAEGMFDGTFNSCSGLSGSIPEKLFAGISGAPASSMFVSTFSKCSGLSGSIPENLFAGINGAPASFMFSGTFMGCSGLSGSIPENLFAGINGAPAGEMFNNTFYNCSGLSGSIPENLFAGIKGVPANWMFYYTFSKCSGLSGSIPENLFAGIKGAPANRMFEGTFYGCRGLSGSIPENLFTGISGAPADYMFYRTFYNCGGLFGSIPANLFAGIDKTTTASDQMTAVFNYTGLATSCPASMYQYLTGFESYFSNKVACEVCPANFPDSDVGDNATIDKCYTACPEKVDDPVVSGHKYYTIDGLGNTETCKYQSEIPEPEFTVTTTELSAGTTFSFTISAAGTYYIDWGDGGAIETIVKGMVENQTISHTYTNAGKYTIGMSGQATLYSTGNTTAAISFEENTNISGISGSLGAIFGTLTDRVNSDGTLMSDAQPRFYRTFLGCSNLSGNIPENLFAGISGAPAADMFHVTFSGCSGLSGSIPENLFAGINGAPASYMFSGTFSGCSGLSGSIPENLFAGISGAPAGGMFYGTFSSCSGLSGSIPENLFAGIKGAPASYMFYYTFYGCRGLSGSIPENLFVGISGAPADSMFHGTFFDCSNLSGNIPEKLFAGISGAPADSMFHTTFAHCYSLSGSIPENLFAGIKGAPASHMFWGTFLYCSGLSGSIPANLFTGIDKTTTASDQMADVFYAASLATSCPSDTYQYLTGFESYFNGKVACSACPADYPNSDSGATSENECYKTCEAEKVPGYVGVGNEYYGTDTCELTECADGWRKGGISDVIGKNQADKRGVMYPDYFSEDVWSGDYMDQDYYGISEVNSFAVDYGNNGMVKGRGICSTKQGEFNYDWDTNTLNVTTFDELDDETGNYDAQYCYCQVNEYVPDGGRLSQSVSGKWVFHPNYYSSDDCRYYCGSYCADMMVWSDDYQLSFRNAVLGGGSNSDNQCKEILYKIPAGQYIVAGSTEPTKCPSGYYCPGMGDVRLSDDKDQGLVACPDGYDNSDTGAKTEADCYKPCVADDVVGAMSVTGKNYYGDGADTCAATECVAGWMVKDLSNVIKNASASNSTYINNNGDITDSENKGLAYYGISDKNSFAVDYGKRGILTGHGRCSTQEGVYNFDWNTYTLTDVTVVDSLADETGMDGAQYCYCQVDGVTPVGGLTQILSDQPWVYYQNFWDSGSCANDCARACSDLLRGNSDEGMAMRQVLFGPSMCVQASYRLNAGTYLPAGEDTPTKCPVGYYCPRLVNVKTDEENDQGLFQCPVDYPDSDEGAMDDTYCYTSCKLENMDAENVIAVTGKDYYGTGADTCVPSECAAGWIVQDLTGIAGQDYALNSAYVSTNSGVVGLVDSNGRDMMYYGISELNSFALDFGSKGIITGRARCSSIEGTNNDYTWTDPTILDELSDETGQEGAYHCYCQVDGFTMPNKVVQQVSGPWVYHSNYWGDYEYCANSCAGNCAQQLKYNNSDNMAFRKAMFVPTMCVQESYRINAGTYLPAGDDAPAKCPVGYYCPGVVNVKLDEENDQGLSKCPSEYPNSDTGATADTQCYTKCTINDVANSMTVVGNNYYGTGIDTCEASECAPGWLLDLGLGEYAVCADTLSYIEPGTYLPAGKTVVEICLPGSYCPGADNVSYNVDANQGIFACPTEYPNSYTGAKVDTECYQTCKIDNGDVTTSGNGNIYYGDENNTCELTECADGWMLKDFAKKIGTENGINSAYVSTNSMSYGQFVEEEWNNDSVMGQMYYGISKPGEFAVGFGENGMITGHGRCSTKSGVKNYDWGTQEYSEITTFDELDDESGNYDARYCYCHVDSYTSVGGLTQVLSRMPWVFNSESWSGEGCDSYCAAECVSYLRNIYDDQGIAFRAVAFGAKPQDPAICIEESYRLNPGMYLMAGEDTPTKCPSGSYCPGAGDVILNSDKNQGIVKCPSGYSYSDTGATDDTQCYSLCTTGDVANSTSVIGNDYYGDGADTCSATQCVAGWKLRDLSAIIGTASGLNSACISTNSYSYGEFRDNAGLNQDYYGLSEPGEFAVDYGDTGIITGRARCSTKPGVGGTNPTVFKELDDESGVDGAQYCYCQVNGYFKQGELIQAISGPWVYSGNCSSDGTSMCEDSCGNYLKWNGTNELAFRSVMFGGATCEQTKYRLTAGTYLPAGAEQYEQCLSGYYCPGAIDVTIDENKNQGIVKCPNDYPYSDAGVAAQTQCYKDCTSDDVANAMTVVGRDYYGDGKDTCKVTECVSGWHVKLGLNLEELVGSTYEGSNSSYMAGTNSAYINNAGDFVEYGQYEEYGQEYYGISENNSFAVIYDDDKGMITGRARCSSQSENSVENLPDESGNSDAYNCYCTIDSYTPVDGTKQTISAPWIKYGSISWYPGACESNCVQNCASNMREHMTLDFRGKMFEASVEIPMCLVNKININWNLGYGDNNSSTTTCSYNEVIMLPQEPVRPGYIFTGWKVLKSNQ